MDRSSFVVELLGIVIGCGGGGCLTWLVLGFNLLWWWLNLFVRHREERKNKRGKVR